MMLQTSKKDLQDFKIKLLALIFMLFDHIYYFLNSQVRYQLYFLGLADYLVDSFYL